MRSSAISRTSRLRRPRKSIFSSPSVVDRVHLVLRDDGRVLDRAPRLGFALDRQVLGERLTRDHHRGGVDPVLTPKTFESPGDVDDALGVGIGVVEHAQLGRHLVALVVAIEVFQARAERRVAAHDERRHQLGDLVPHCVRVPEHPRGVAHCGTRLDGGEGDHLRDVIPAVPFGRVADHLAAVAGVEVHVDVGHRLAAGVEKPLEQQVVADRVDVGDAQAIRHARSGRAPAPGPDADAVLARIPVEVPHDEEVRGEPHRFDDAEFVVECARALPATASRRSARFAPSSVSSRR